MTRLMLLNDLFVVDDWQPGEGTQPGVRTLTAAVHLRFPHPIFDGHFPGRPVLPGACLVQLVAELAASVAGGEVRLIHAGQIKFISMIDPLRTGTIVMTLTGKEQGAGEWQITAGGIIAGGATAGGITAGSAAAGATFFRFKGVFRGE